MCTVVATDALAPCTEEPFHTVQVLSVLRILLIFLSVVNFALMLNVATVVVTEPVLSISSVALDRLDLAF